MTWKTHIIGGAQIGLVLGQAYGGTMTDTAIIMGTAMLGSVLPDIDHEKSKLAQGDVIIGLASASVCKFTKHRGFTHTVPGAAVFAIATYALMMFNSAQQALIALISAFSGFFILQIFGAIRRYSVLLALAAYLVAPRAIPLLQGKASPIEFSPGAAFLAAVGVFAGCLMHDLYDSFTKRGAPLLWPLYRKPLHFLSVKTRGVSEGIFASAMLFILATSASWYYRDAHLADFLRGFWNELASFAVKI